MDLVCTEKDTLNCLEAADSYHVGYEEGLHVYADVAFDPNLLFSCIVYVDCSEH